MSLPAGVILSGGRSSRMGGGPKALAELAGRPMISHVIGRLGQQVDRLILSAGEDDGLFVEFGLPVAEDIVKRYRGPLTGLCSAFRFLDQRSGPEWLLLAPCDAPFLPADLVTRLLSAAQSQATPVAVARYSNRIQPTFSLWHTSVSRRVCDAVMAEGQPGLKHLVSDLPNTIVDWEAAQPSPFFNVNTPEDLTAAERWLDPNGPDGT
jgi:molybdopterin-guanine dinucleotide biosynthesis protein A